ALAVRGLFGGENLDKPIAEQVHPVRLADVAVERRRIELRKNENPAHIGVQAVADWDIDQAIFAADRHSGLRAELRERKQPFALTAAKDERENFVVRSHLRTEC